MDKQTKWANTIMHQHTGCLQFFTPGSMRSRWGHSAATDKKTPMPISCLTALPSSHGIARPARPVLTKNDRPTYHVAVMVLGKVAILGAPQAMLSAQPPPRAVKKVQPTRPSSYLWHELVGLCTYQVMGWSVGDRESGSTAHRESLHEVQNQMQDHIAPMSGLPDHTVSSHHHHAPTKVSVSPPRTVHSSDSTHLPQTGSMTPNTVHCVNSSLPVSTQSTTRYQHWQYQSRDLLLTLSVWCVSKLSNKYFIDGKHLQVEAMLAVVHLIEDVNSLMIQKLHNYLLIRMAKDPPKVNVFVILTKCLSCFLPV